MDLFIPLKHHFYACFLTRKLKHKRIYKPEETTVFFFLKDLKAFLQLLIFQKRVNFLIEIQKLVFFKLSSYNRMLFRKGISFSYTIQIVLPNLYIVFAKGVEIYVIKTIWYTNITIIIIVHLHNEQCKRCVQIWRQSFFCVVNMYVVFEVSLIVISIFGIF